MSGLCATDYGQTWSKGNSNCFSTQLLPFGNPALIRYLTSSVNDIIPQSAIKISIKICYSPNLSRMNAKINNAMTRTAAAVTSDRNRPIAACRRTIAT